MILQFYKQLQKFPQPIGPGAQGREHGQCSFTHKGFIGAKTATCTLRQLSTKPAETNVYTGISPQPSPEADPHCFLCSNPRQASLSPPLSLPPVHWQTPELGRRPGFPGQGNKPWRGATVYWHVTKLVLVCWLQKLSLWTDAQQLSPLLNTSWRKKSGDVFLSDTDESWCCWRHLKVLDARSGLRIRVSNVFLPKHS